MKTFSLTYERDYGIDKRSGWSIVRNDCLIVQFERWLVVAICKAAYRVWAAEIRRQIQEREMERVAKLRVKAIQNIRRNALAFGHDLSAYTDEEIEAGVARFSEAVRGSGVAASEAVLRVREAMVKRVERDILKGIQ